MPAEPSVTPTITFDPLREAKRLRIGVVDRADGGREFILPARRNFGVKLAFSSGWLVMAVCLVGVGFFNSRLSGMFPGVVEFIIINHTYLVMLVLGLIELVLTIICFDLWLRSSRLIVTAGNLQVVTRWLLFKRAISVPAASILEIRADGTTSVGWVVYFDLVVLTVGQKPGWLAAHFPARRRPGGDFSENDLKVYNSGGKRITAATGIKGKQEADWLVAEVQRLLKFEHADHSAAA